MNSFRIGHLPWEAILWIAGLTLLASLEPDTGHHFTICPLALAGLDFCPGCGLGRSITLLFHGMPLASLEAHPLGIFAVGVLLHRIYSLTKTTYIHYGKNH